MIGLKNSKANPVSVIVSHTTLIIGRVINNNIIVRIPRTLAVWTVLYYGYWLVSPIPFAGDVIP